MRTGRGLVEIANKVKGQPVPVNVPAARSGEVVDIADALRRSLANLKKPVQSAEAETTPIIEPKRKRSTTRTTAG